MTVGVFLPVVVRVSPLPLMLDFSVTWLCPFGDNLSLLYSTDGVVVSDFSYGSRDSNLFGCSLFEIVPKILLSFMLLMERPLRCLEYFDDDRESVDLSGLCMKSTSVDSGFVPTEGVSA